MFQQLSRHYSCFSHRLLAAATNATARSMSTAPFYQLSAKDIKGQDFAFSQLQGKVVLVVNVASKVRKIPERWARLTSGAFDVLAIDKISLHGTLYFSLSSACSSRQSCSYRIATGILTSHFLPLPALLGLHHFVALLFQCGFTPQVSEGRGGRVPVWVHVRPLTALDEWGLITHIPYWRNRSHHSQDLAGNMHPECFRRDLGSERANIQKERSM